MRELFVILAVTCFSSQSVALKKYFTSLSPPCARPRLYQNGQANGYAGREGGEKGAVIIHA
jgi:hypothetical protein